MATIKRKPKAVKPTMRTFEAENMAIQSLRLIAAPNPKDDLSEEELVRVGKGKYTQEFIQHLIECIKSI